MSSEFRGKAANERHFHAPNVTGVAPAEKGYSRPNRGVENGVENGVKNGVKNCRGADNGVTLKPA
jgi:hypothetical protein